MIVQDIYLNNYDWNIRVYYATDEYFISNILMDLLEIDCDKEAFFRIKSLMESGKSNIGFTYSNTEKRASLMLIGVTDSADEFQSTFDHEKGHLSMHICSALGIEPFSEEYQYLAGEIGKRLFKVGKEFLCEHCRKYIL
jgi:hypothetical protein